MRLHRNSQKRIVHNDGIYFITSKTKDNFPFFEEPIFCELPVRPKLEAKRRAKADG